MSEISRDNFIIFPTQLFEDSAGLLQKYARVYLVEEPFYFTRFRFHRLKLAFHRATMQQYVRFLRTRGIRVIYRRFNQIGRGFYSQFSSATVFDPVDHGIADKLRAIGNLTVLETPAFPETLADLLQYREIITRSRDSKSAKPPHYSHDSSFYRWQRRRMNILMTGANKNPLKNKPKGGKWTYDAENRKKFPANQKEPVNFPDLSRGSGSIARIIREAIAYTDKHFGNNPGSLDHFIYPIDFAGAKKHFRVFLRKKLRLFGDYEDAIARNVDFGYHSVISCLLNVGLLTPQYVIDETLKYANRHKVPMNSLEGFIRQVIGWRSYCRMIYEFEGRTMRKMNKLGHKNRLSRAWWAGNDKNIRDNADEMIEPISRTGLMPVDVVIGKVQKYAYAHHIERLMILGNAMLLCMIHPDAVFEWFISYVAIDAYDWVMVPNIYGMSQYADGGIMMTRPYFSSANYILKMSDYSRADAHAIDLGREIGEVPWPDVWDALFYNFVDKHANILSEIYSTANFVKLWKKKSASEKKSIRKIAGKFIKSVTR